MTVLVTVLGPHGAADLELDDERPLPELAADVAVVLGQPTPATLLAEGGAELGAPTLAAAGVLDGQRLVLLPAHAHARDDAAAPDAPVAPAPPGRPILTCYLAVDTSDSMAGRPLDAVNAELARLWAAVRADPRLADGCRLGVVTFDAEARVHAQPAAAARLGTSPHLAATRPATDYEAVFRLLRRQVTRDLTALRAAGHRPLRPLVVLLTDGRPTRGYWPPAHAALVDAASPDAVDLVAFGFGEAAELAIRRIGTAGAFMPARAGDGPRLSPPGMLAAMMGYVHQSLRLTPARPEAPVAPPPIPAGWRPL
jgi:uncharacterized protein YegL